MKEILDDRPDKDWDKYYFSEFWCGNCGRRNGKYIKKGILLKDVSFICFDCGCPIQGKCYGE